MERKRVDEKKSSQIRSIGYDPISQTLEIEFSSGGIYDYFGVPEGAYEDFIHADSLGQFVATRIRGQYEYKRLHIAECSPGESVANPMKTYVPCGAACPCWCHRITRTSTDFREKKDEKEKPKKASKKAKAS